MQRLLFTCLLATAALGCAEDAADSPLGDAGGADAAPVAGDAGAVDALDGASATDRIDAAHETGADAQVDAGLAPWSPRDAGDGSEGLARDDAGRALLWSGQQAYIKASNTPLCGVATYCDFGRSVALSADGNTLAVGSPQESSPSTGIGGSQDGSRDRSKEYSGAVYVFTRSGSTWLQQAYIKASNAGYHNFFGSSVSLSADGNVLAVGAPGEGGMGAGVAADQRQGGVDDAGLPHSDSGAVYVFARVAGAWSQESYVKAENARYSTHFGAALAVSGDGKTLAVGSPEEFSAANTVNGNQLDYSADQAGAVYILTHGAGTCTYQAYLKPADNRAGAHFGSSISLSYDGDMLATSARAPGGGAAYTFARTGTSWSQHAQLKVADIRFGQAFAPAVALSGDGDTLAAGAWMTGQAYVYRRADGGWSAEGPALTPATLATRYFGWSLALSFDGNRLAVGDSLEKSSATGINGDANNTGRTDSGAVYGATRASGGWTLQEYVKASNTYYGTQFGNSVALSRDGLTLAVGSYWELSNAVGINGNQDTSSSAYGAVYIFQ